MKKIIIISSVLISIILGIILGVIVHNYDDTKVANAQENEVNKLAGLERNQVVISASTQKEKTSPNCNFKFETRFNKCGHSDIENKPIEKDDINKTKEELAKKYSEWEIESFSTTSVKFVKNDNGICSNHFIIKESNGKITVYKLDNKENETFFKSTDIEVKYLPEEDQESLKVGIMINGELELTNKLIDYE